MKRPAILFLAWLVALVPNVALAADFSQWAVLVVSGDNLAHSGKPTKVFDNARRDLVKAFTGIGFKADNVAQFSVTPDSNAQHTAIQPVANTLWDLTRRAPAGCLVYFTSHGVPEGIVMEEAVLAPENFGAMINNSCGTRPAVVVMSACYSGQFVPAAKGDNRVVITASRADRTSFGCGETNQYTFFDDCFLRAMPMADGFPRLGSLIKDCVAFREKDIGVDVPSEPQLSIGKSVAANFNWK